MSMICTGNESNFAFMELFWRWESQLDDRSKRLGDIIDL